MNILKYKKTEDTPSIIMNPITGIIAIQGKSYPENIFKFYEPILEWLSEYFNNSAQDKTIVNLEITYFNSGSSKLFFTFFNILLKASKNNTIEVNWYYHADNENALDVGQDFIEDFKGLNINLIKI